MPLAVAGRTTHFEFLDHGVEGLLERRNMVVLQELGTAAISTGRLAFLHHPLLPHGRMTLSAGRIDRSAFGIVDQCSQE